MDPKKFDYNIIEFQKKYLRNVMKLYEESYKRSKPANYFRYRLSKNPYGKPIIFLMKFKEKIVGFYAVHPIVLQIKNRNILGGYSFLTMTHPEHTGKGIFTKLAIRTYQEAKKRNYNFIMGFANQNSFLGFIKKLGFIELKPINSVKVSIRRPKDDYILPLKKGKFPTNALSLWNLYKSKDIFPVKAERNLPFLNWRYKHHPIFTYLVSYDEKIFFVFKKYNKYLHMIDFFGQEDHVFYDKLLDNASYYANLLGCKEITFWIPRRHPLVKMIKSRYEEIPTSSHFVIKILNKRFEKSLKSIDNWYYTMGESDVF